ncbi:hypothetical protein PIB30_037691, partial [Stylosanthes scabra]|nr:hypothetical protein [Stylosanthes scabra]
DSIAWSFIPRGNDTHFTVVLLVRFGALADYQSVSVPRVLRPIRVRILSPVIVQAYSKTASTGGTG